VIDRARRTGGLLILALAPALALGLGGCASWKPALTARSWTLYVKPGSAVDLARLHASLEPAFAAVEERMGPFERRVRVHAWDGDLEPQTGLPDAPGAGAGEMQEVPGIGPARVRAFHVRASPRPFSASGVFLGTADTGTAVHELVHARLAEQGASVPLWFEEGLASLYGDGVLFEGRWTIDGLACWPLRELRALEIPDAELGRLLALDARDRYDARENLLVHFVGWAIVFELQREAPGADWRAWHRAFGELAAREGQLGAARRLLERATAPQTEAEWLARLADPDPARRLAAAKGLWKLRSPTAVDRLLEALREETHREVRVGMALNALLSTSELRLGYGRWRRLASLAFPALRDPGVEDPAEREAALALSSALRGRRGSQGRSQAAFDALTRLWEE
jgi:hypothetical protein